MKRDTISLSELWRRIVDKDLEQIRERFRDPNWTAGRHAALQFGPMDWAEVAFLDALKGRIQLQDHDGELVAVGRTDIQDLSVEVEALLQDAPSVGDLDGCRIGPGGKSLLEMLPEGVKTPAALYRPGLTDPGDNTFIADDDFYTSHMKLAMIWSRRTWQIDFALYDALVQLLGNAALPDGSPSTELVDMFLGPYSDLQRKWGPYEGMTLTTDRAKADRSFKRNFHTALSIRQNKGGRPATKKAPSRLAVDEFFKLFAGDDVTAFLTSDRRFRWQQIRQHIGDKSNNWVSADALRVEVSKDARFPALRTRIRR